MRPPLPQAAGQARARQARAVRTLHEVRERSARRGARVRAVDAAARIVITIAGWSAIVVLGAIMLFLAVNAWRAIDENGLFVMLSGRSWYPTGTPRSFGFLPSIVGSLWVTAIAMTVAAPLGVAAAVYISEFAPRRLKDVAKSAIEFMAAIPSVVIGLIGVYLGVPFARQVLDLPSGLTALTAGLFVAFVSLPTIVSISEDAMHAVPSSLRQGSLALGNTRWQTTYKVVVPAAGSGVFAAVMLGLGRAIGETMIVLMLAGNSGVLAASPFESVRTLTGTIGNEMGEVVQGGLHFSTLFAMGLVLFVITFLVNLAADAVLERQRARWRR